MFEEDNRKRKYVRFPCVDFSVSPFIVIWETTFACDLACKHCRADAVPFRAKDELSYEESEGLLEEISKFGRPLLVLTGGDPFKREDIFDIIKFAVSKNLPVSISPSVTPLFTDDVILKLKQTGIKAVSLSLDGPDEQTHDSFRGVDGVFRRTIEIWKKLVKSGIKVQINTTVSRFNIEKLPEIFFLVAQNRAMTWSVFFLVEVGRAFGKQDIQITPQEFEDIANFLYDAGEYIWVKTTEGHHFKRVFIQREVLSKKGLDFREHMQIGDLYFYLLEKLMFYVHKGNFRKVRRRTPMNVNAGRGFIFISKNGDVFPSGFLPLKVGSVRERSIVEIYRNSEILRSLRNYELLKGKCKVCEFREVCGGSRSRAYAYTKDPYESEPLCIWKPGSSQVFRDLPISQEDIQEI